MIPVYDYILDHDHSLTIQARLHVTTFPQALPELVKHELVDLKVERMTKHFRV
jgi:hypothetical protein